MPCYRITRTETRTYTYDIWRDDAMSATIAASVGGIKYVEEKEGVERVSCIDLPDTTVLIGIVTEDGIIGCNDSDGPTEFAGCAGSAGCTGCRGRAGSNDSNGRPNK